MGEIKTARDIAQEKIEQVGSVTEADKLRWKYFPEGEKWAAKYLKEGYDLVAELATQTADAVPFIKKGMESVFLGAVSLPHNEAVRTCNQRAMEAILVLKQDRDATQRLLTQMQQVLDHYTDQGDKQRKATKEALKEKYEDKLRQALDKQLGGVGGLEGQKISAESLPQFHEEWRRVSAQLDRQYLKLLEEFKHELAKVS